MPRGDRSRFFAEPSTAGEPPLPNIRSPMRDNTMSRAQGVSSHPGSLQTTRVSCSRRVRTLPALLAMLVMLAWSSPWSRAQRVDTLGHRSRHGAVTFYNDPTLVVQAARFDLREPATIRSLAITLGGTGAGGGVHGAASWIQGWSAGARTAARSCSTDSDREVEAWSGRGHDRSGFRSER